MKIITHALLAVALAAPCATAFAPTVGLSNVATINTIGSATTRLFATDATLPKLSEVEKLRSMAEKLREEATSLELEQKQAMTKAAMALFERFDTDKNGVISVSELKVGLEKKFKMELPQSRAQQLVQSFDSNNDGVLQPDEFAGVDAFRTKLEAIAREERDVELQLAKDLLKAEEEKELALARMEFVNDRPPTAADKTLSVLPYVFPLVDGLQFARFFIEGNPENPVAMAATFAYFLYRSIPLGGLISYFALSFLSENPQLNRLVRFNLQQAVFLDFALFVPAIALSITSGLLSLTGTQLPPGVAEIASDVTFITLAATVAYASVSSLLGETPNQLPWISDRVEERMLSADMYDAEGRFVPFDENGDLKTNKKNDGGNKK